MFILEEFFFCKNISRACWNISLTQWRVFQLARAKYISLYRAEYKFVHAAGARCISADEHHAAAVAIFYAEKMCYHDQRTSKFGFVVIHENGYALETSIYVLRVRAYWLWQNSVCKKVPTICNVSFDRIIFYYAQWQEAYRMEFRPGADAPRIEFQEGLPQASYYSNDSDKKSY